MKTIYYERIFFIILLTSVILSIISMLHLWGKY